jgi:ParB family chromosome partitioning protein
VQPPATDHVGGGINTKESDVGRSSKTVYGAAGSTNLLTFRPEDLVIVTDKASPLYDRRAFNPIDEAMVKNIMAMGVLQAIIVALNPETGKVEVVDGRQRVINTREANIRLEAKGCEPVLIPAMARTPKKAEDSGGVMVSANEIRTADTPMGRAEKMAALMGYGKTPDDLAVIFGCTVKTVQSTLALLDCCAAVKSAVEAGKIGAGHAQALAKMSPEDQRAKVKELTAAGDTLTGHAKARKQRDILGGGAVPKMRTRKQILAERDAATGIQRAVLQWVLGEAGGTLADAMALGEVADALKAA